MNDVDGSPPVLLFIVGPPAVGKMAVGHEISLRTGMPLLHNHVTIEPVLRVFPFGHPAFTRLVHSFRASFVEEVADSDLPGLIFTAVWAFEMPEELESMSDYARPFVDRGHRVIYLELEASQEERLRRNSTEFRVKEKPSKANLEMSERILLEHDSLHRFNSSGELDDVAEYLRVDNTHLTPEAVALQVIEHFGLPLKP